MEVSEIMNAKELYIDVALMDWGEDKIYFIVKNL